jgi:predicted ester cyclase
MSDDELRTAVRRFFDEVWNKGNVGETESFLAPEFVSHNTFDVRIVGPREYGEAVTDYRASFPDLQTTLEDVLVDGDRVVVRGTDRGTHRGDFMGFPASGRQVTTGSARPGTAPPERACTHVPPRSTGGARTPTRHRVPQGTRPDRCSRRSRGVGTA